MSGWLSTSFGISDCTSPQAGAARTRCARRRAHLRLRPRRRPVEGGVGRRTETERCVNFQRAVVPVSRLARSCTVKLHIALSRHAPACKFRRHAVDPEQNPARLLVRTRRRLSCTVPRRGCTQAIRVRPHERSRGASLLHRPHRQCSSPAPGAYRRTLCPHRAWPAMARGRRGVVRRPTAGGGFRAVSEIEFGLHGRSPRKLPETFRGATRTGRPFSDDGNTSPSATRRIPTSW